MNLDPKWRLQLQYQSIVDVFNKYRILLPQVRNIEMLKNKHNKSEQKVISVKELIQEDTDEILLN